MTQEFTVLHLFSGIGGAALGFQQAVQEYRGMVGRFRTLAGIDCDPDACRDFEALTGAPAVQMDLFTRADYVAFHGHEPPGKWAEAKLGDLLAATGGEYPDVVFLSPPCKGFSGLLPTKSATSEKYQALNRLVVRGLKLVMDAFVDDLPAVIMLENVPRITSRGEWLLRQVKRLLGTHGYVFHEGFHDCGEIGGLGQRRRRYLLIARLPEKMSAFIYRPPKRRVKSIGEIIGPLPMPNDPEMGPMHRLPRLKWLTWVRLALIPAGGDWRDLVSGKDTYRIIPSEGPAGKVIGGGAPSCGGITIPDPRLNHTPRKGVFQVAPWDKPATTIIGSASVRGSNGLAAVADPRIGHTPWDGALRLGRWEEPAGPVLGSARVTSSNGMAAVADPRIPWAKNGHGCKYQVVAWEEPSCCITGTRFGNGVPAVADPRLGCRPRSGSYGVMDWNKPAMTVTGAGDVHAGAAAVADPRIPQDNERPDPPPVIISTDGTWHRPLTTYELAMLQSLPTHMPDGRPLTLAGKSDARWRERIGNAVPPPAAKAIGEQMLTALLASQRGEWTLGATGIWVREDEQDAWTGP